MYKEKVVGGTRWAITYDKAIREDGSLFFESRLSREFLDEQRRVLGTYIFTNQYLNEVIPEGNQDFKRGWLKYYDKLPDKKRTFAFIDPAISLDNDACFTACVVVDIDDTGDWYLRLANRAKITATQTVKLVFDLHRLFKCDVIGIEDVAYQRALLHFLDDEMRRVKAVLPVKGVKRGPEQSKSMRIRSLVPRFEWGRIFIKPGLHDFESEYLKFPRGAFVDILDALASIEDIAYKPQPERKDRNYEPRPNSPGYESWYISRLAKKASGETA